MTKDKARRLDLERQIDEVVDPVPSTDPALWTIRRKFGVAGGPDEVVLTDDGRARAFSFGAQVRGGPPAEALEALWHAGGDGYLTTREGARIRLTELGRFDQLAWGVLRSLGYVESFHDQGGDGVRLTTAGKWAAKNGIEERESLLRRCRRAAAAMDPR